MTLESISPDYDAYWKEIITTLFADFVQFFLPDVHEQIDFDKPPEFLEQELQTRKNVEKRYAFKRKLVTLALEKNYTRDTIWRCSGLYI